MIKNALLLFIFCIVMPCKDVLAQNSSLEYIVDLSEAEENIYNVELNFKVDKTGAIDLMIPEWTPGYYQILDFSKNVSHIEAINENGNKIPITKLYGNTWRFGAEKNEIVKIKYKINTNRRFVATPYIDLEMAFIRPTGVFISPKHYKESEVRISLKNNPFRDVITGLAEKDGALIAQGLDQLYDSPILLGDLEMLEPFYVKDIPHYFGGYNLDLPTNNTLTEDLSKMINAATDLMQDIPYQKYSFMAIGSGGGGIEQYNSTAFALNPGSYHDSSSVQRTLNFLTHEYFHHFNVKRIRPIELGPFDYSKENRTNLLWVSEGLTVYFEDIILNRAQLKSREEMIRDWAGYIEIYENNEGRKFQSLAESSYNTWEDGPFGIKGKTISYYEKGPLIGMFIDLKIRSLTENKYSLIDVMRELYQKYYKTENRGFTENEFKDICETFAGSSLDDIFEYVYNKEPLDYNKYLNLAGLTVNFDRNDSKTTVNIEMNKNLTDLQRKILNDLFRVNG